MAEVHAAHVQWFGGEELRWRADAMLARCQWPKAHDDALPELAAAYEYAARDETVDADELCRWAVAYTDAALTLGAFGEALAVASDARERLGDAMPLDRIRLDLELDWLDAAGEQAAAGAEAWADVLASGYGRDPEMAGRIRQRQGVWYVRETPEKPVARRNPGDGNVSETLQKPLDRLRTARALFDATSHGTFSAVSTAKRNR